jgi:hypothetical protein
LILEKKEFEHEIQLEDLYNMINSQEEHIQSLSKQLQHQARKSQAALQHAKMNMNRSIVGGLGLSFVGVSDGQSFVMQQN